MTTNLAESFNAWLKEERHYTIFNLVMTHMDKFAHLACDHMGSTENWKAAIGPKTEEKLLENIIKSGSLPVLASQQVLVKLCSNYYLHQ